MNESRASRDETSSIDLDASRLKVVYILGSQRGGTTILGRALTAEAGFVFAGELRRVWKTFLNDTPCGCGLRHESCPVWSTVVPRGRLGPHTVGEAQQMQDRAAPSSHPWWTTMRLLRSRGLSADQVAYRSLMIDLYRSYADATDARVLVDGSKDPSDVVLLRDAPGLELHPVHIVRDPRGAAASRRSRADLAGRRHPFSTAYGSVAWSAGHRAAAAATRPYGDRAALITYEGFVEDPGETIAEVVSRVTGRAPASSPHGRTLEIPTAHTPGGKGRHVGARVEIELDERWRSGLSRWDSWTVRSLTRGTARRFGYSL